MSSGNVEELSVGRVGEAGTEESVSEGNYVVLEVLGKIQEKGFEGKASEPSPVAAPGPRVIPFPQARHRSEGPRWRPAVKEVYQPPEAGRDEEEVGVDEHAKYAQPLLRKNPSSRFGRFVKDSRGGDEGVKTVTRGGHEVGKPAKEPVHTPGLVNSHRTGEKDGVELKRGLGRVPVESSLDSIDRENRDAVLSMCASELEEARLELKDRIRPEILEMLRKRGEEKERKLREGRESGGSDQRSPRSSEAGFLGSSGIRHANVSGVGAKSVDLGSSRTVDAASLWTSWSARVNAVRLLKFDLDGRVVAVGNYDPEDPDRIRELKGDAQTVAERDLLRTEGDPAGVGYTILEAAALARSTVPGQRTMALRLLSSLLSNALSGLQQAEVPGSCGSVDWQAVWTYAVGPEPRLTLTLRYLLDDKYATIVSACARALQALLSCAANESFFDVQETYWLGERPLYTAPVFRRQTKLDEGCMGGGRWKYNVKPSEMSVATDNQSLPEDRQDTVGDHETVAEKDVAAALIRMGILPRIRYILEVEKNVAAEESLLVVVIALAHHSPAGAEAVMKCPRLMDTIIQQFLASDENMVLGIRPARTRAIQLLKVLSQASRSNCVRFAESGALQVAQSELFQQAYLLPSRSRVGQEYLRGLGPTLIEALRLWRVCISHQIGISLFSDFYPALCFWLAPYSEQEYNSKGNSLAFCLTRESFTLLEKIARTLPLLHWNGGGTASSDEFSIHTNWSWAVAVPLVKTALDWLSSHHLDTLLALWDKQDVHVDKVSPEDVLTGEGNQTLLGALAAVLHFLATVCGRILPLNDMGHLWARASQQNSYAPWLPTFLPQLGLSIVNGKFLNFAPGAAERKGHCLAGYLYKLRLSSDYDTSIIATSCLHGIVRLVTVVDHLIREARPQASSPQPDSGSQTRAHEILSRGLLVSGEQELRYLLDCCGGEVILNQTFLSSIEFHCRGGPAPGIGLGWGSVGGGTWSKRFLLAKITAVLALDLLVTTSGLGNPREQDLVPVQQDKSSVGTVCEPSTELSWRFQVGLGVVMTAGPGEGDFLKKVLSSILLDKEALTSVSKGVLSALKVCAELKDLQDDIDQVNYVAQLDVKRISDVLQQHFTQTWLSQKWRKDKKTLQDQKNGTLHKLTRIDEDNTKVRDEIVNSVGREWAGQRLPLPVYWFQSPLATNVEKLHERRNSGSTGQEVEHGIGAQKAQQLDEVIGSGLFFLLAVEVMLDSARRPADSGSFHTSMARKVHALSTVFVLGGHTFLQDSVQGLICTLQEMYALQLDGSSLFKEVKCGQVKGGHGEGFSKVSAIRDPLDLYAVDNNYTQFVETLTDNFSAESYGALVFARQVAFYLRRDVPDPIRLSMWEHLAESQVLHLLPPLRHCCGNQAGYLYPVERNTKVLDAYLSAWTFGKLDKAADLGSMSFFLVLHHIALFVFGESAGEDAITKTKFAKSLLRSVRRKPSQQILLLQLISYQVEDPASRFVFLTEVATGDKTMLDQLETLKAQSPG